MKRPDKYCYPAIFTYVEGEDISVTFPDLSGCATCGTNEEEALDMAKDALGGHLWCMEEDGDKIPEPSSLWDIQCKNNERVVLISVYMPTIRLAQVNRSVNRTVTLPAWLNAAAMEKNINFSQLLQEALKNTLNVG